MRIETLGHFSTYGDSTKGDYLVTVAGDDRELALFHDTSSDYDAPKVGDDFPAEIIQGKRGEWRLKRASRQGGGGNRGGGGKDDKNFDRRPEHPRNEARMIHTSSLSAAPSYISQMLAMGFLEVPKDEESYWLLVSATATRLTKSYRGVLKGTESAPVSQPQLNGGEVPADTAGLTPAPAGVSDDVPF